MDPQDPPRKDPVEPCDKAGPCHSSFWVQALTWYILSYDPEGPKHQTMGYIRCLKLGIVVLVFGMYSEIGYLNP